MTQRKQWQFLKPGDIVDVIAPASQCPPDNLIQGCEWLKSLGLIPRVSEEILKGDVFFASPLESQLKQFEAAMKSDSKAVWCVRGGYGSMRLIPHLKRFRAPKVTKFFIGFSDITSLHLFISQNWKWPVIHGRNLSQMLPEKMGTVDREMTQKLLLGEVRELEFPNLIPLNKAAMVTKSIRGEMTGGNLRIVQSSIGTKWEIQPRNKILFLEDVGERGYSVHRMLEQLIQVKLFHRNVKALVFGDFTESEEKNGKNLVGEAFSRFADQVSYPVLKGLPCGHGEINYPLPFNTPSVLKLAPEAASLTVESGGILLD